MKYLVVAAPNDHELAAWIGKKGTENGLSFYNRSIDDVSVTVLAPTNVEEKFYSMAECLLIAKSIIISTKNIDANFGEAVIASSLLKRKVLLTDDSDVSAMIGKLGLEHEVIHKESILGTFGPQASAAKADEKLRIDVDKAFPVKGVGTVILGIVRSGTVSSHDKLYSGAGKEVQVRSIQVQDQDSASATEGARVGLAVKGVSDTEIESGEVLAKERIIPISEFSAKINFSPVVKEFSEESQYSLITGFSVVPCKIAKDGDKHKVKLVGVTAQIEKGQKFIVIREKKPRVLCAGEMV